MCIGLVEKEQAWQLRHEVMWPDRELDYVKLPDDDLGLHYGLWVEERLASVVSLFVTGESAQFRKFATAESMQGRGYGSALLRHVLEEADRAGAKQVVCNARSNKVSFYRKFGMVPTDQTFSKGGKDYVILERRFDHTSSGGTGVHSMEESSS